jgi:hypothetical protein
MISESVPLPEVLKGKLEFGNREQIDALRNYEIEITKQEESTKKILSGTLTQYQVTVEYTAEETFTVWASDKKAAEEAADDIEGEPWGWEVEHKYVREIKKD